MTDEDDRASRPVGLMPRRAAKRLLVAIHDVGPRFEDEVDALAARLTSHLEGNRYAMLVVPCHWGGSSLSANSRYRAKLRRWADDGVEMFVHGWFHRDASSHSGMARFKARHMTAGEGEFLGLSVPDAARRMRDGKALIEDITGRPATGFVAPAWLYGKGALEALRWSGFAIAEDHARIWRPADNVTLARGPVITWASRSALRTASSLAFAALARTALGNLETVRIGVHPGDLGKPSLLASIDATLARFAATHEAGRYNDLLAG